MKKLSVCIIIKNIAMWLLASVLFGYLSTILEELEVPIVPVYIIGALIGIYFMCLTMIEITKIR